MPTTEELKAEKAVLDAQIALLTLRRDSIQRDLARESTVSQSIALEKRVFTVLHDIDIDPPISTGWLNSRHLILDFVPNRMMAKVCELLNAAGDLEVLPVPDGGSALMVGFKQKQIETV